ncbi:MAG: STAS/SEC14 domain-containing protein [Longimicrobiales bacterium]|nr:STAS/SEC14 domain-containing protein [Longimicrobiales bacterium]
MIQDLPRGISGVIAQGKVTKHDYEATLRPLLKRAEISEEPLRLLYAFHQDFEGFTPDGAWEDVRLAFDHLDDVERCAVVADEGWIERASQLAGALTPLQVRKFSSDEWDDAVAWLAQDSGSNSS